MEATKEIKEILKFIELNKLENIKFEYNQINRNAIISGIKDGYKYETIMKFNK